MFDYRLLEALAQVVQEGGFERAARALYLTQSAVSQRIRQLEEKTGQILLTRTSPPQPTPAGQQLIKLYHQVNLLEKNLGQELQSPVDRSPTVLPIGINADSLSFWFIDLVGPLLLQEGLLLDLLVDDQEQTHKFLRSGRVIGCISTEAKPIQGCRVERLGRMNYRMLASPDFTRRWFSDGFTQEACSLAPAVIFNRKDNLHGHFLRQVFDRIPDNFPTHYVPSPEPFLKMISAGYSYGMVPDLQGMTLLSEGRLLELVPERSVGVELYWHCWNLDSKPLRRLTERLVIGSRQRLR